MNNTRPSWLMALALYLATALVGCSRSEESLSTAAETAPVGVAMGLSPQKAPNGDLPLGTVTQGKLTFVEGYQDGYQQALAVGKPSMVVFTDPSCHYCQELAVEAFADRQVISLARRFVCVLVDVDREPVVCQQFRIRSFPTILFLSPRGVPLNRFIGKRSGPDVAREMQAALQATARRIEQPQRTSRR